MLRCKEAEGQSSRRSSSLRACTDARTPGPPQPGAKDGRGELVPSLSLDAHDAYGSKTQYPPPP